MLSTKSSRAFSTRSWSNTSAGDLRAVLQPAAPDAGRVRSSPRRLRVGNRDAPRTRDAISVGTSSALRSTPVVPVPTPLLATPHLPVQQPVAPMPLAVPAARRVDASQHRTDSSSGLSHRPVPSLLPPPPPDGAWTRLPPPPVGISRATSPEAPGPPPSRPDDAAVHVTTGVLDAGVPGRADGDRPKRKRRNRRPRWVSVLGSALI